MACWQACTIAVMPSPKWRRIGGADIAPGRLQVKFQNDLATKWMSPARAEHELRCSARVAMLQRVDPSVLEQLVVMGFEQEQVDAAARQLGGGAGLDVGHLLEVLLPEPEPVAAPAVEPAASAAREPAALVVAAEQNLHRPASSPDADASVASAVLEELEAMGFPQEQVQIAARRLGGGVVLDAERLLTALLPSPCPICARDFANDENLETHWQLCFDEHCPVDSTAPLATPTRRRDEEWLGSHRLPPEAASLVLEGTSVPERLTFAQASRGIRNWCDSDWHGTVDVLWRMVWSQTVEIEPNGGCGCYVHNPKWSGLSAKEAAVRLWRACSLTAVHVEVLHPYRCAKNQWHRFSFSGSSTGAVLLQTRVRDLKARCESAFTIPVDYLELTPAGAGRRLSHLASPLAAYVWHLLDSPTDMHSKVLRLYGLYQNRRCHETS